MEEGIKKIQNIMLKNKPTSIHTPLLSNHSLECYESAQQLNNVKATLWLELTPDLAERTFPTSW